MSSCLYKLYQFVCAAAMLCILMLSPVAAQNKLVPVFVYEVKTSEFVERLEALGTLKANEAITLTATVSDTVSAVHFDDGQRVKAGDVLIEMTSAEEHAELEEARFRVDEALRQFERVKELKKTGTAPDSLLDERRREYETAKARLHAFQSRLQDRLILAPFDGIVGIREISLGALVQPGDVITSLDDDRVMKLDFSVPSTYLDAINPGLTIVAKSAALKNVESKGQISSVNFRVDPVTRSVRVRALLPNDERKLRPGLLMSVELFKKPREAIIVPEEAIVSEARQHFVYVIDSTDDKAVVRKREVALGVRQPGDVEVLSGLESGELIVTHGTQMLRDGNVVTIRARDNDNRPLTELLEQAVD